MKTDPVMIDLKREQAREDRAQAREARIQDNALEALRNIKTVQTWEHLQDPDYVLANMITQLVQQYFSYADNEEQKKEACCCVLGNDLIQHIKNMEEAYQERLDFDY